jgi:hypothetical protein
MSFQTTATSRDFIVAEIHSRRGWTPHIFSSQEEFITWRQRNPALIIVDRRAARGRMYAAIDHRDDWLFEDLN